MRFYISVVAIVFLTSISLGVDPASERTICLRKVDALKLQIVERAVIRGMAPNTATAPRGMADSWPLAGRYVAFRAMLLGNKYVLSDKTPGAGNSEYRCDGAKHVEISDAGSWKNVHVSDQNRPAYPSLLLEYWLPVQGSLKFKSSRVDPQFGDVVSFTGANGSTYEFAKDRDWILLRRGGLFEVLGISKVGNCWVATELVRRGASGSEPDIYSSISAIAVPSSEQPDFSLPMKSGYLWIDKNVYYVVVDGKLVRSRMQPVNTKGWWHLPVICGLLFVALLWVGSNWNKLFGKSNGSVFDEVLGTERDEKNV